MMTFKIKPCETQQKWETVSDKFFTINIPSNKENELASHKKNTALLLKLIAAD